MRVSRGSDRPAAPWKNGNGRTEEIFTGESTTPGVEFEWRLSAATIDGVRPYSSFPEIDRLQMLVSPNPLTLTVDGEEVVIEQYTSVTFPGEATVIPVSSTFPYRVLNLMVRRGRWTPSLELLRAPRTIDRHDGAEHTVVAFILEGAMRVGGLRLMAGDAAELNAAAGPEVPPDAAVAVAHVLPTRCTDPDQET